MFPRPWKVRIGHAASSPASPPAVKVMMPFACVLSLGDEQSDDKGLTPAAPTLRSPPHPHTPGKGRYHVIRRVRSGAPTTRAWTHADCTHTMTRVDEKPIVQMQVGEKAPRSEPHTVPGSELGWEMQKEF